MSASPPGRSPPPPSPALLSVFSALVEDSIGLHYGPHDAALFADKLQARATVAGFDSLFDYYYFLRYDPESRPELARLLEALVVHETYFFREQGTLDAAVSHLIAPAIARGERPRIWSCACSTGEEPLTLAMILAGKGLLDSCDLVASDVSPDAVARARSGLFGGRALRALPQAVGEGAMVHPEAKRQRPPRPPAASIPACSAPIEWRTVNLLDGAEVAAVGPADLVLCRNVLIYFSDVTIGRVVDHLSARLRPEGRLAVGASESLLRFGTVLTCEEIGGAFFYRRPASALAQVRR